MNLFDVKAKDIKEGDEHEGFFGGISLVCQWYDMY